MIKARDSVRRVRPQGAGLDYAPNEWSQGAVLGSVSCLIGAELRRGAQLGPKGALRRRRRCTSANRASNLKQQHQQHQQHQ
jgi:hypothetical protein